MLRFLLFLFISNVVVAGCQKKTEEPLTRDPLRWPFSATSIWNTPIGSDAVYAPAQIEPVSEAGMTVDEDYMVMTPEVPLLEIYENFAGWDRTKSRCGKEGKLLFSAPIPKSFIVSPVTWDGLTPNAGLAVLMPDKRTIRQTQPFAHCDENGPSTSQYMFDNQDIYGEGLFGAHGGSALSAIGGTLRCGELAPNSGPIRHVMKINLYGAKNLFYDDETKGFRWPAKRADGYASTSYYTNRNYPVVKACRMGALLALPVNFDIESLKLETEPAKILAKAFQDYGAYVVDDTGWNVYGIVTEWGPAGRFTNEFKANWGFSFSQKSIDHPWSRDMAKIVSKLCVVDNNSPATIGGGGKPRVALAPEFKK